MKFHSAHLFLVITSTKVKFNKGSKCKEAFFIITITAALH